MFIPCVHYKCMYIPHYNILFYIICTIILLFIILYYLYTYLYLYFHIYFESTGRVVPKIQENYIVQDLRYYSSIVIIAVEIDKMSADVIVEIDCGANKVHGKYRLNRRHAYDRMFDLGRRRQHLQTSRLSIDSGSPRSSICVDQPLSIMYTSHRIIQDSRSVGSYWKILRLTPSTFRYQ